MQKTAQPVRTQPFATVQRAGAFHILATVTGLFNFVGSALSVPSLLGGRFPTLPLQETPLRFFVFLLLETVLAAAFAHIVAFLLRQDSGLTRIWAFLAGLAAAWISLFNAQWLIIGGIPKTLPQHALLAGMCCISLFLGVYLLIYRWRRQCRQLAAGLQLRFDQALQKQVRSAVAMRVLSFTAMYVLVVASLLMHENSSPGMKESTPVYVTRATETAAVVRRTPQAGT